MRSKFIILLLVLLTAISCTHSVHMVHVGDFKPYQRNTAGEKIEAKSQQTVFLGFTLETDYVNNARKKLMNQCTNGSIQGPVTRLSTSHGFFSWTNTAYMQALCVKKI